MLRVRHGGEVVAEVPAASLSEGAPRYQRRRRRPDDLDAVWADQPRLPDRVDAPAVLLTLLSDPAIGDPSPVFQQYDHQLFLDTVVEPGHDGSLLRIKGTEKGIAVSTDGDGPRCALDPRRGAARIVWEAALNVAVTGARPYALVDNLNLGNPERPEVMWQLVETVEGLSDACEAVGIPVVGGNVSFYNETDGVDIPPTPVVGMLGLADPRPARPPRLDRAEEGMAVWMVGPEDDADFAASAFARLVLGHRRGRPAAPDPALGSAVVARAVELAGWCPVLHDVSTGGLAVALAEIAIRSGVGVTVEVPGWRHLFSEGPHRVVAVAPDHAELADSVPARRIGSVGGDSIDFGAEGSVSLEEVGVAWETALRRHLA
jgi:phosphoribosylformylglycinamidine synthase